MRTDFMPQSAVEVCACITVLAAEGKLTADDEAHIEGWIKFRRRFKKKDATD